MSDVIFNKSEIQFHTASNCVLYQENDPDKKNGILKLRIHDKDPEDNHTKRNEPIYVRFSIDCSSSMSQISHHGHTKMYQAIYSLKNIFHQFADNAKIQGMRIFVSVVAFDCQLHPVLDFTQITWENLNQLLTTLDTIHTCESTNIEQPLRDAQETLNTVISNEPDARVYHVFMTDGNVTDGEFSANELKKYLDTRYPTTFIGFGKDHDSHLLTQLSDFPHGDYRFIDKIENAGYVYGEIVYNIIYNLFHTLVLVVRNGLIHDWKRNMWYDRITIANVPNNCEKLFHLMTYDDIYSVEVDVYGITNANSLADTDYHSKFPDVHLKRTPHCTLYCYPPLLEISATDGVYSDADLHIDLSRYHWRLKAQELMFNTQEVLKKRRRHAYHHEPTPSNFDTQPEMDDSYGEVVESLENIIDRAMNRNSIKTQENAEVKHNLCAFLRDLTDYMNTHGLTQDLFLCRLGDDIYILFNTLERNDAQLWCASRQISQGSQHTYMPSQFIDDEDEISMNMNMNMSRFSVNSELSCTVDFWDPYRVKSDVLDTTVSSAEMIHMMNDIASISTEV